AFNTTDNNINSLSGFVATANNTGMGSGQYVRGGDIEADNQGGLFSDGIKGLYVNAQDQSQVGGQQITGAEIQAQNLGNGTSSGVTGLKIDNVTSGGTQTNNLIGLDVGQDEVDASAIVNNRFGISVGQPFGSQASTGIGNNYGIYIQDQSSYGTTSSF